MASKIVETCIQLLTERKLTVAFAESATAGRLCAEFSLIPHCGAVLKGGIVCYDASIKKDLLGVPPELVEKYMPESAEVTEALVKGLPNIINSGIQVGVTGLTMNGGSETEDKPVGTMFIHIMLKNKSIALKETYKGDAEAIVLQTVDRVAQLIIDGLTT